MPSIVGHFAMPFAARVARALPWRLLTAGLVASTLPDVDTLLGATHGSLLAHRGITHPFAFALVVACIAPALAATLGASRRRAWLFVFACAASHPLLDACTNGGSGVMLGWPLTSARVFAPWRPIEVSPIGIGFFSRRGVDVVLSELAWLVVPALASALLVRTLQARRA